MITDRELKQIIQRAAELMRQGRYIEAERSYEIALSHEINLPECWYNLAFLQRQNGRFDAALASYQQALDRGASQPEEIHLNRGVIFSDFLRMDDAAEKELETALALNSNYIPALLNLANLKEDRGDRNAALALYDRILALDQNYHLALARYASLRPVDRPDDPLIKELEAAIARTDATAADRANLGFALGQKFDQCASYDRAFAAFAAANLHSRESAGSTRLLYDKKRHEDYVDLLIEIFSSSRAVASGPSTSSPIFICGMFRSGSTLVEQVLASHPRVIAGGELSLLPAIVDTELAPFPASFARVSATTLAKLAGDYDRQIAKLFPHADRVTDKRPDNFFLIGLINAMFPQAKIINTKRNALDNCLSIYFLHLDHSMGYALDLIDTAHYYRQYLRLMTHWKSIGSAKIFDFDYDEFVREPRSVVERLLSFCGLDWDDACMSFHQARNVVKTASVWQVRQPLYRHSSGRWRNYDRHIASLRSYVREFDPQVP